MLMPKRVKWRKQQRGRMSGKELRGVEVSFGDLGLQALEPCWMTQRQLEAARRTIVRYVKRKGKMWVRVFPDKPVTKKPQETRPVRLARMTAHAPPSAQVSVAVWVMRLMARKRFHGESAKSRTQDNQNGSQPSTTGQGGERSQQPAAGRDQRRDTSNPAANPNSPQGNANDEKK